MQLGLSRKRLRRSTRSCYQCVTPGRKRKVKCQLTDENVETCAQCEKSGTACTLQPPETEKSSGSSPVDLDMQEHMSRLGRIESLLKRLVETQESSRSAGGPFPCPLVAPTSLWDDLLLHPSIDGSIPPVDSHTHDISLPPDGLDAKQTLVALLPSAQDAVTIVASTTAWLWGAEVPYGSVLQPNDTLQLLDIATISRGNAMHVAKTLLLFALYMQQLPTSFDVQSLEDQGVEEAIELIVERVKLFVLSHDNEACSLDGIECLTLLSLIQINNGAVRKAWMILRRILDLARLKRLHSSFTLSARDSSDSDTAFRRRLWLSTVCGDCYCSLLLGLEPGLGIAPFGPDNENWNDPLADDDANIQRRICLIVARIAQRNSAGLHQNRDALQEIDGELDRLQDSIPVSWWRAPSFDQNRSFDSAKEPNRLICQMWFLQARAFAHMPFAFLKTMNGSLNSLESCMEACRITLHRFLELQHAKDHFSRCKTVDQSAFLAAVILLLAKVQLRYHKMDLTASRYDSDQALLEQASALFKDFGKVGSREHIARQSSDILSTMLDIVSADSGNALFTTKYSSDPIIKLTLGTSLTPTVDIDGALGTTKYGMEDIIASSIQPVLDPQSPASNLIDLLFATKRSDSDVPNPMQDLSHRNDELTLDDLIDTNTLK